MTKASFVLDHTTKSDHTEGPMDYTILSSHAAQLAGLQPREWADILHSGGPTTRKDLTREVQPLNR